jgi:hypothetical protein
VSEILKCVRKYWKVVLKPVVRTAKASLRCTWPLYSQARKCGIVLVRFYRIAIFAGAPPGHCIFFNVISMASGRPWQMPWLWRHRRLGYHRGTHLRGIIRSQPHPECRRNYRCSSNPWHSFGSFRPSDRCANASAERVRAVLGASQARHRQASNRPA